ncbi:enoyl-CoA hydratase/isomerase family protein [Agromyces bauzanensis]
MVEIHDGIAYVTLEGVGRNLLNPQNMAATVQALREADADAEATGIVVTGAGDTFCGGLDVEAIRAGGDPVEFAGSLVELLKIFPRLTKPVVASVNGDALASGASIVAACDYAVAIPTARVGTYEVSVGIWPMVAQVPLIQRMGARAAMENIGAGEPFTAERARELGLLNTIAEASDLDDVVRAWLRNAARGGAAVAAGRPAFYELAELPYAEALDSALDRFASMFRDA